LRHFPGRSAARRTPLAELIPLLNVEDVSLSLRFYTILLGAEVESQWGLKGRVLWARIGFRGGKLMLNTPDTATSAERRGRTEFADTVLYLMCDDAPARRDKLLDEGLAVSELSEEEYGNVEFSVRDPDGYAIRFSSPHG